MVVAEKFPKSKIVNSLVKTGQMTLSFYVLHVTVGMVIFSKLFNKVYTGYLTPMEPVYILTFAILFYILCVVFSILWTKKHRSGPPETVMRKISG